MYYLKATTFMLWIYFCDNQNGYQLDLYPSDFMISLAAPENYIGAKKIFGGSEDEFSDFLVPIVDWDDEFPWKQKKSATVPAPAM